VPGCTQYMVKADQVHPSGGVPFGSVAVVCEGVVNTKL
jgi:hypothetical protein